MVNNCAPGVPVDLPRCIGVCCRLPGTFLTFIDPQVYSTMIDVGIKTVLCTNLLRTF